MDAPEDYAREENFDDPIIQDVVPVDGGHLVFDDEGNVAPEDLVIDDQAHGVIPVEDNDLINNEYDAIEAPINVDLPADTSVQQ